MKVSSFRDRFNPEAVHFPSHFRPKLIICCGAFVCLLSLAPAYWVEQPVSDRLTDTVLVLMVLLICFLAWPSSLTTDQFGISRRYPLPFRRAFIPWKEVASVEEKAPRSGLLAVLGIRSDKLIVYSMDGRSIAHTPLHGDRARFKHELKLHGVVENAEADSQSERQ